MRAPLLGERECHQTIDFFEKARRLLKETIKVAEKGVSVVEIGGVFTQHLAISLDCVDRRAQIMSQVATIFIRILRLALRSRLRRVGKFGDQSVERATGDMDFLQIFAESASAFFLHLIGEDFHIAGDGFSGRAEFLLNIGRQRPIGSCAGFVAFRAHDKLAEEWTIIMTPLDQAKW